jgi:tetratricopeptide (TPR) repeat protein
MGLYGLAVTLVGLLSCQSEPATKFEALALAEETRALIQYPAFLINPDRAGQYRQEGLNLRRAGDLEGAIAALKIATALDPKNLDGQVILGWTQHLAGNRTAATQTLQIALRQNQTYVPALNALGIVYLVDGQLDAAVATHTHAAALKPDNEIAHYNLSLAYERLGQFEQAINHGQTATELEPGNPHPWVALALAHWSSGNQEQAQAYYGQALSLDGRYANRAYLDHLEQAGFSQEQIATTATLFEARF